MSGHTVCFENMEEGYLIPRLMPGWPTPQKGGPWPLAKRALGFM